MSIETLTPDLTTTPLAQVSSNPRLQTAIDRVREEATNADDGISAFNSSI